MPNDQNKKTNCVLYRSDSQPEVGCLKGTMSENHLCVDCGFNTAPRVPTRIEFEIAFVAGAESLPMVIGSDTEMYMVHDKVWEKAGMEGYGGCLCIGCLEKRIGRRQKPKDFNRDHPFSKLPGTPRLLSRRDK